MKFASFTGALFALLLSTAALAETPTVTALRVPDSGIHPQVTADDSGTIHLVYFKGDAAHGDLFYVRSTNNGETFSKPIRVNSQIGSVLVTGTVRGPQIAVGKGRRPHVIWMGSTTATARVPGTGGHGTPLLYTRLDDSGSKFEPERNVIATHVGLDGGLSIAADNAGNVYAVWHAPEIGKDDEASRRVWVSRSMDDGEHFAPEVAANSASTGACGCCGIRAFCDRDGALYVSYRSAREMVNRDMYLLTSRDYGKTFHSIKLDDMKMGMCVMSTTAIAAAPMQSGKVLAAWETMSRVFFATINPASDTPVRPLPALNEDKMSKHPALAANASGQILLTWTEGTGWQKGGSVAWQVFDSSQRPLPGATGHAAGLEPWSVSAAFVKSDGSFVILY